MYVKKFKVLSVFVLPSFVSIFSNCCASAKVTRCDEITCKEYWRNAINNQQSSKILKIFKISAITIILLCLGTLIAQGVSYILVYNYLNNFVNEFKNSGLDSNKILSEYRNNLSKEDLNLLKECDSLRENHQKLYDQIRLLSDKKIEIMIHVYENRKQFYDFAEDTFEKIQKIDHEIQKIWKEKYAGKSKDLGMGEDFLKDDIEEFFKNCGKEVKVADNTDLITRIDIVKYWCEYFIENIEKEKISEDKVDKLSNLKNFAERVLCDNCVKAKHQDILDTLQEIGYPDAEDFYSYLNDIREYRKSENFVKILNLKSEIKALSTKLGKLKSELKFKKIKKSPPPAYQKVKEIESDVRKAKEIIGKGPYTLAFLTEFSEYMKLRENFDTFKGTENNRN